MSRRTEDSKEGPVTWSLQTITGTLNLGIFIDKDWAEWTAGGQELEVGATGKNLFVSSGENV